MNRLLKTQKMFLLKVSKKSIKKTMLFGNNTQVNMMKMVFIFYQKKKVIMILLVCTSTKLATMNLEVFTMKQGIILHLTKIMKATNKQAELTATTIV